MSNLHFDELDDKTIKLMHEAGITPVKAAYGFNAAINRLLAVVRADEREACIDIVMQNVSPAMVRECEDAIRARGEK